MTFLKNISNPGASDQELVTMYQQSGDPDVLAQLYQRYMELAYAVCLKYLKDQESAKDAVMSIFEELVLKLKKHEVLYFKGWLHTLVKNHCLMLLRSKKTLKTSSLDGHDMHLTEELHLNGVFQKEAHFNQLQDCMDTLSDEQKKAVELFYLKEKCYKEIAEIASLEYNKVRSLIQNGRRNLKNCMEQKNNEAESKK